MSDTMRSIFQLVANILGAGFVTIMGFSQFAEYLIDRHARHIAAALAWWVLVPVLVLRTAGVTRPPLLDAQLIADWAAIGWAVCLLFGITWGVLRLLERKRERDARRRLGLTEMSKQENER